MCNLRHLSIGEQAIFERAAVPLCDAVSANNSLRRLDLQATADHPRPDVNLLTLTLTPTLTQTLAPTLTLTLALMSIYSR